MLQNRVDPFGNIIITPARGNLMGNRGVIHNAQKEIVRPFKLHSWITCVLEFKNRKRKIMEPNRWTELFFLDEATSFAAGHRPCAECRRQDFNKFKLHWIKGNPSYGFDEKTSIKKIDEIIHNERTDKSNSKIMYQEKSKNIPNGSFILLNNQAYLMMNNKLFLWSPFGYDKAVSITDDVLTVITPKSVVNAFRYGYLPGCFLV